MVKVGGNEAFVLSSIESQESIIQSIAIYLRTIPQYINVTSVIDPTDHDQDITVTVLYNGGPAAIIPVPGELKSFESVYQKSLDIFPQVQFLEFMHLWLGSLRLDPASVEFIPSIVKGKVGDAVYRDFRVIDLINNRAYNFERRFELFKKSYEEYARVKNAFDRLDPIPINEFHEDKFIQTIKYRTKDDLYEIFDKLKMNRFVPFASFDNYFKVYNKFKYMSEGWQYTLSDTLFLAIVNGKSAPVNPKDRHFSGCYITKRDSDELVIEIDVNLKSKMNNLLEILIERLKSALDTSSYQMITSEKTAVGGYMVVPDFKIYNKYIFADLILNTSVLNNIFFMDEHLKMTKSRKALHFIMELLGENRHLSATIDEYVIDKSRFKHEKKYPLNTVMLKIQITQVKNEAAVAQFKKIIGKVLTQYVASYNALIQVYKDNVPGFVVEPMRIMASLENQRIGELRPSIYISGYGRKCQSKPKPRIINAEVFNQHPELAPFRDDDGDDDDAQSDSGSDAQSVAGWSNVGEVKQNERLVNLLTDIDDHRYVIRFPKNDINGDWIGCARNSEIIRDPSMKFIYPGMIANNLANEEEHTHLPCCYEQDQREKPNFLAYYEDQKRIIQGSGTYIKKTDKISQAGDLAYLPERLNSLLTYLGESPAFNYYRQGNERTPSSLMSCILWALKGKRPTGQEMEDARNALAASPHLKLCLQSAYDFTYEALQEYVLSFRNYLDPKIFYLALEKMFNIYIVTISLHEFIVPARYRQLYVRLARERVAGRRLVVVIENNGIAGDHLKYPQCELLIHTISTNPKEKFYSFLPSHAFAKNIFIIENQVYSGYAFTKPNVAIERLFPAEITAMGIDSQGKMTIVYFGNICAVTDPLPPLEVDIVTKIRANSKQAVLNFLNESKIVSKSITVDRISCTYGGVNYSFPLAKENTSHLYIYNECRRAARYLQEYMFYMYSRVWLVTGRQPDVIPFVLDKTVVIPDYKYPLVSRQFDLEGPYMQNGKLIVHSRETALRLGYAIRLQLIRREDSIRDYSRHPFIRQYYQVVGDFRKGSEFIIVSGENALREWIAYTAPKYQLLDHPIDVTTPYFIEVKETGTNVINVYLVQPALTYEEAVGITDVWASQGYNDKEAPPRDMDMNRVMNVIYSGTEVKIFGDRDSNVKILIWRANGQLRYGALFNR
jgi:hypothetical protein